jgi:hypothetical protein
MENNYSNETIDEQIEPIDQPIEEPIEPIDELIDEPIEEPIILSETIETEQDEEYDPKTIFDSHDNLEIDENVTTKRDIKTQMNTNLEKINNYEKNDSSIQKEQDKLIDENKKIYHDLKEYEKKINELKKINQKLMNEIKATKKNTNFLQNIQNKFEIKIKEQKYKYNSHRIEEFNKKYTIMKKLYLHNKQIIDDNNKEANLFKNEIKSIKNENKFLNTYIHDIETQRNKTKKTNRIDETVFNKTRKNVGFMSADLIIPERKSYTLSSKSTIPLEEPDDILPPLEEETPSISSTTSISSPIIIKKKGIREIDKKLYERQKKLEKDKKERLRILKQIKLDKEREKYHLERLVQFNSFKYPENKHCPAGFSRDPQTRRCVKKGVKLHSKTKKHHYKKDKVRNIKKIHTSRKHKKIEKNKTRKNSVIIKKPYGSARCPNGYKMNKETKLCVKKGEKVKFIQVPKKDLLKYK